MYFFSALTLIRCRSAAALLAFGVASGTALLAAEPGRAGATYAPVDLEVIDVDATVAIATKAGQQVPIVLSHDADSVDGVVAALDTAFTQTRARFFDQLEKSFGVRALGDEALGGAEFRQFRADFQADNAELPVSPALGQTWAKGFDGEPVRERIAALLRSLQREQLIGEVRPASSVYVVASGSVETVRSWGEVGTRARGVDPAAVLSLPAAGELLRRTCDPLDRSAAGYLGGLLRANVAEDRYLTGLLLRDRMGDAVVRRALARGTPLTADGRPLDRWAALALEQLARVGIQPADAPMAVADPGSQPTEPRVAPAAGRRVSWLGWILGGFTVVLAASAAGAFLVWRRRGSLALQVSPGGPGSGAESMIPHMARELKDRLVRALFTQRSVLLANEQAASRRVQEMEERLARLQPAIAERIRSYEQRIEALEKEIAERDAETRDLLRAKLVLARKELDAEISRSRITWN